MFDNQTSTSIRTPLSFRTILASLQVLRLSIELELQNFDRQVSKCYPCIACGHCIAFVGSGFVASVVEVWSKHVAIRIVIARAGAIIQIGPHQVDLNLQQELLSISTPVSLTELDCAPIGSGHQYVNIALSAMEFQ